MQHDGPPPQDAVPTPPTSLAHAGPDPDNAGAHDHQTVAPNRTAWADNAPSGPGTDARDNDHLARTGHWHSPEHGYYRTDDEFDRHTGRPQSQILQPLTGAGGPWAIRREHAEREQLLTMPQRSALRDGTPQLPGPPLLAPEHNAAQRPGVRQPRWPTDPDGAGWAIDPDGPGWGHIVANQRDGTPLPGPPLTMPQRSALRDGAELALRHLTERIRNEDGAGWGPSRQRAPRPDDFGADTPPPPDAPADEPPRVPGHDDDPDLAATAVPQRGQQHDAARDVAAPGRPAPGPDAAQHGHEVGPPNVEPPGTSATQPRMAAHIPGDQVHSDHDHPAPHHVDGDQPDGAPYPPPLNPRGLNPDECWNELPPHAKQAVAEVLHHSDAIAHCIHGQQPHATTERVPAPRTVMDALTPPWTNQPWPTAHDMAWFARRRALQRHLLFHVCDTHARTNWADPQRPILPPGPAGTLPAGPQAPRGSTQEADEHSAYELFQRQTRATADESRRRGGAYSCRACAGTARQQGDPFHYDCTCDCHLRSDDESPLVTPRTRHGQFPRADGGPRAPPHDGPTNDYYRNIPTPGLIDLLQAAKLQKDMTLHDPSVQTDTLRRDHTALTEAMRMAGMAPFPPIQPINKLQAWHMAHRGYLTIALEVCADLALDPKHQLARPPADTAPDTTACNTCGNPIGVTLANGPRDTTRCATCALHTLGRDYAQDRAAGSAPPLQELSPHTGICHKCDVGGYGLGDTLPPYLHSRVPLAVHYLCSRCYYHVARPEEARCPAPYCTGRAPIDCMMQLPLHCCGPLGSHICPPCQGRRQQAFPHFHVKAPATARTWTDGSKAAAHYPAGFQHLTLMPHAQWPTLPPPVAQDQTLTWHDRTTTWDDLAQPFWGPIEDEQEALQTSGPERPLTLRQLYTHDEWVGPYGPPDYVVQRDEHGQALITPAETAHMTVTRTRNADHWAAMDSDSRRLDYHMHMAILATRTAKTLARSAMAIGRVCRHCCEPIVGKHEEKHNGLPRAGEYHKCPHIKCTAIYHARCWDIANTGTATSSNQPNPGADRDLAPLALTDFCTECFEPLDGADLGDQFQATPERPFRDAQGNAQKWWQCPDCRLRRHHACTRHDGKTDSTRQTKPPLFPVNGRGDPTRTGHPMAAPLRKLRELGVRTQPPREGAAEYEAMMATAKTVVRPDAHCPHCEQHVHDPNTAFLCGGCLHTYHKHCPGGRRPGARMQCCDQLYCVYCCMHRSPHSPQHGLPMPTGSQPPPVPKPPPALPAPMGPLPLPAMEQVAASLGPPFGPPRDEAAVEPQAPWHAADDSRTEQTTGHGGQGTERGVPGARRGRSEGQGPEGHRVQRPKANPPPPPAPTLPISLLTLVTCCGPQPTEATGEDTLPSHPSVQLWMILLGLALLATPIGSWAASHHCWTTTWTWLRAMSQDMRKCHWGPNETRAQRRYAEHQRRRAMGYADAYLTAMLLKPLWLAIAALTTAWGVSLFIAAVAAAAIALPTLVTVAQMITASATWATGTLLDAYDLALWLPLGLAQRLPEPVRRRPAWTAAALVQATILLSMLQMEAETPLPYLATLTMARLFDIEYHCTGAGAATRCATLTILLTILAVNGETQLIAPLSLAWAPCAYKGTWAYMLRGGRARGGDDAPRQRQRDVVAGQAGTTRGAQPRGRRAPGRGGRAPPAPPAQDEEEDGEVEREDGEGPDEEEDEEEEEEQDEGEPIRGNQRTKVSLGAEQRAAPTYDPAGLVGAPYEFLYDPEGDRTSTRFRLRDTWPSAQTIEEPEDGLQLPNSAAHLSRNLRVALCNQGMSTTTIEEVATICVNHDICIAVHFARAPNEAIQDAMKDGGVTIGTMGRVNAAQKDLTAYYDHYVGVVFSEEAARRRANPTPSRTGGQRRAHAAPTSPKGTRPVWENIDRPTPSKRPRQAAPDTRQRLAREGTGPDDILLAGASGLQSGSDDEHRDDADHYASHPLRDQWTRQNEVRRKHRDARRGSGRDRSRSRSPQGRWREDPEEGAKALAPNDIEMTRLQSWVNKTQSIRLRPHQIPSPQLIGKLRYEMEVGSHTVLMLSTIETREQIMRKHSTGSTEQQELQWVGSHLRTVPKKADPISTFESWTQRWHVARNAYYMAGVLHWDCLTEHLDKVRTYYELNTSGGDLWPLIEETEVNIRTHWVMDTGTTQITPKGPRIRTFQDCAYRRYSWLWTRGIQWRLPHVIGRNAKLPGLNDAAPNRTATGDVRALEPGEEKPPKEDKGGRRGGGGKGGGGATRDTQVASYNRSGKSHTICKDFQKPGGCKRKNCKFKKMGHVCAVKGCQKSGCPAHDHPHRSGGG